MIDDVLLLRQIVRKLKDRFSRLEFDQQARLNASIAEIKDSSAGLISAEVERIKNDTDPKIASLIENAKSDISFEIGLSIEDVKSDAANKSAAAIAAIKESAKSESDSIFARISKVAGESVSELINRLSDAGDRAISGIKEAAKADIKHTLENVKRGEDGKDGKDGRNGKDGEDGAPGIGIKKIEQLTIDSMRITLDDGRQSVIKLYRGPRGSNGGGSAQIEPAFKWSDLALNWDAPPVNLGGGVYRYTWRGVDRFRFVPDPYTAAQDAFYNDAALTDLIVSRGI